MIKLIILSLTIIKVSGRFVSTSERVTDYGYPIEEYEVETDDGYLLTMFRIPYSPVVNNSEEYDKPVVFLMHGLLASSDSWILNGPNDAMAFLLANAGYDVWMGNARGNVYSRKHKSLSPVLPLFWDFSWHEIGVYDVPAMIDFMLSKTKQNATHYIGHSQGTTSFFVMLSEKPSYNDKLKTCHLLAPVGYMNHMESPLAKVLGPILGQPNIIASLIGDTEFMPNNVFFNSLGPEVCRKESLFLPLCENVYFLMFGWDSLYFNETLMSDVMEIYPAGSSTRQILHYLQEYKSARFCQYDFGILLNEVIYDSWDQPDYVLENIHPFGKMYFYYSLNDYLAAVKDVQNLACKLYHLGENVEHKIVSYPQFNHADHLWSTIVKYVINDCVIDEINKFENKTYFGLCTHFLNGTNENICP